MTVGKQLRAQREAKQMSIGDVARRTFIQPKFLQAIDDDNLSAMPESHVRLFVREYAKAIGMNPEALLTELGGAITSPAPVQTSTTTVSQPVVAKPKPAPVEQKTTTVEQKPVERIVPKETPKTVAPTVTTTLPKTTAAPVPSAKVPAPVTERAIVEEPIATPKTTAPKRFEAFKQFSDVSSEHTTAAPVQEQPSYHSPVSAERHGESRWVTWLVGTAILLLLCIAIYYMFIRPKSSDSEHASTTTTAISDSSNSSSAEQSPSTVLPRDTSVAPSSSESAITNSGGDSLTLEGRATTKLWYSVTSDGKTAATGTLDSGATKTWRAAKNFRVSLGNAGGLNLSLNGKQLGTLGPKASTVRNKLIDSAGVSTAPLRPTTPGATIRRSTPSSSSPSARSPRRPNNNSAPAIRPITPTGVKGPSTP